ncbi:MAG: hypothetical protein J7578_00475 [Chitinophagaceae bacterium]|nr:hypothetical protein [Chitinophagaceae bacterium]
MIIVRNSNKGSKKRSFLHLSGYFIELRFNNGKVVRQGFSFYPKGKAHFVLGGNDYVPGPSQ